MRMRRREQKLFEMKTSYMCFHWVYLCRCSSLGVSTRVIPSQPPGPSICIHPTVAQSNHNITSYPLYNRRRRGESRLNIRICLHNYMGIRPDRLRPSQRPLRSQVSWAGQTQACNHPSTSSPNLLPLPSLPPLSLLSPSQLRPPRQ